MTSGVYALVVLNVDDQNKRAIRFYEAEGLLTPEEQAEYGRYVSYATIAILKSKARQLLAASNGE